MATVATPTTTHKPTPTRKPRPKPPRFCKIIRTDEVDLLIIREVFPKKGEVIDAYVIEGFPSEIGGRGVELTKDDGTKYHVNLDGKASTCDCPGFENHGWHPGPDGEPTACKHIMALLGLEQAGRL